MSKALVITGADFSTNKLTTVELYGNIPCTGVSLSQDTISFSNYTPVTITATKTPANTTYALSWSSSDVTVATVNEGIVTPVGLGTCTITATCGNQTATATITVAIVYIPSYAFAQLAYNSSNGILAYTQNYNYLCVKGTGDQKTEKALAVSATAITGGVYGIKLPMNTDKIKLTLTNRDNIKNNEWGAIIYWTLDEALSPTYPDYIKRVTATSFNPKTETNLTFTVPDGVDSFVFSIFLASESSSSTDPADVASAMGLTVEFVSTENE